MSFLQPLLLVALPLIALPVIIHLINQRRYQTVRWGAMMFLLAANRMARGYAKLRQWLILAMRMLAIAGLIFAMSRPLASGFLGWSGGGTSDATLVILDRSPSMQQTQGNNRTKLLAGREQLVRTLSTLGTGRLVVFHRGSDAAQELTSVQALLDAPELDGCDAQSDIPQLLDNALQYIRVNRLGSCNVWICSDTSSNDWQAENRRWQLLREGYQDLPPGVRLQLLAYAEPANENYSVRVLQSRYMEVDESAEVWLTIEVRRFGSSNAAVTLPLQIEVGGARTEVQITLEGERFELKDHRIPLDRNVKQGWGRVSLPVDANIADNEFYFVFDQPPPRHTLLFAEDPESISALELAAKISPDPSVAYSAEVLAPTQAAAAEWERAALVIWAAPIPDGDTAELLNAYVDRGGSLLFLPPLQPQTNKLFGVAWDSWKKFDSPQRIANWRGDQDVLAKTENGAGLPVGDLEVTSVCTIRGETTPLATLADGTPIIARAATERGQVYFCNTSLNADASNFAANGIVLYVLTQRAITSGAEALNQIQQLPAGGFPAELSENWERVAGAGEGLSTEYARQAGVYKAAERLVAVNRPVGEDLSPLLATDKVDQLFTGLNFIRVDDQSGALSTLVQEIWRLFLVAMIAALIIEAMLCLPRTVKTVGGIA